MSSSAIRRFTLIDAMALIAATALGLALARTAGVYGRSTYANTYEWFPGEKPTEFAVVGDGAAPIADHYPRPWAERLKDLIDSASAPPTIVGMGAPCLTCWTITAFLLSLRAPRPRLRRLARQRGFVACSAATLVIVVRALGAALSALSWLLPDLNAQSLRMTFLEYPVGYRLWSLLLYPFPFAAPGEIGMVIAAVWLNLWLGGRWRAERSSLDRLGRTLAMVWLMMVPLLYWWCGLRKWAH